MRPDELRALAEQCGIELPTDEVLDEAQAYMDGGVVDRDDLHERILKEITRSTLRMQIFKKLAEENIDPNDVDSTALQALLMTADALASIGPEHLQEMGRLGDEMTEAKRECGREQLAAAVARVRDEHPGISRLAVARKLLRDHGRAFDRNDPDDEERAVHALRKRIARLEK